MSGIEDHRLVGRLGFIAELDQGAPEAVIVEVGQMLDLEAEPLQRSRHVAGVIHRIGERRHKAVLAIANDQRDLVVGMGRTGGETAEQGGEGQNRGLQPARKAPGAVRKGSKCLEDIELHGKNPPIMGSPGNRMHFSGNACSLVWPGSYKIESAKATGQDNWSEPVCAGMRQTLRVPQSSPIADGGHSGRSVLNCYTRRF